MRKEPVFYQFCGNHEGPVLLYATIVRQPYRSPAFEHLQEWTIKSFHFIFYYLSYVVKLACKKVTQKFFLHPLSGGLDRVSRMLSGQSKNIPKEEVNLDFERKCPSILFKLEDFASVALLAAPIKASISTMQGIADGILLMIEHIHMVIRMIYDVTSIFLGVFQNLQLVTRNLALALSLIDYVVRSIAMIQYSVSTFIFGFSFISTYLAKLRQHPN